MPKSNTIRKRKLYTELMKGKTNKQAMIDAGFTESTAKQATRSKALQDTYKHIEEDFKLSKITPEYVIGNIDTILKSDCSPSDKLRANELLGKFLALFTDKTQNDTTITTKDNNLLSQYRNNRVSTIV